MFQEGESFSILQSLVYEEHEKVPRWIGSLLSHFTHQGISSGLPISGIGIGISHLFQNDNFLIFLQSEYFMRKEST